MAKKYVRKTTPRPGEPKAGRLSKAESAFIEANYQKQTPEQMAKKLGRTVYHVKKHIQDFTGIALEAELTLGEQLRMRPEWKQFQQQFTDDELREFQHQYVQIMSQMSRQGDVLPTEELQIFQVITLKIQIDRTMAAQRMALSDMEDAQETISRLKGSTKAADRVPLEAAREQLAYASRVNSDCAERYKIYSDKQDKMLNALKATRDQRVKYLEGSRQSWLGLIRECMEDDRRRELGIEAGEQALAAKVERERLSRPHRYADGTEDIPLLNSDTVLANEED